MRKNIYIFYTIILCSCGDVLDPRLKIINNTNHLISMDFKFYADDTIFNNFQVYIKNSIKPKDSLLVKKFGENSWVKELKNSKQLSLYFYFTDSLEKDKFIYKSMYQYYLDRKYFKRITLTEKQLDSCHWVVMINDTLL